MPPFLTVESRAGEPIEFHGKTLLPINQVWQIKLPWANGGLTWNRPASIVVTDAGEAETVIPVRDVTRQVLWFLLGLSLASLMLAIAAGRRRHRPV